MGGACLDECNKVSIVTRSVKEQSAKIPALCSEIIKDYNSGMDGVDLLDQKQLLQTVPKIIWWELLP